MTNKFKAGDKVRRKDGSTFSNGTHIATVSDWPEGEHPVHFQGTPDIWLKETQTHIRGEALELASWHQYIQPEAKVLVKDIYRSYSKEIVEATVVTVTGKSVVVEHNGIEYLVNKVPDSIMPVVTGRDELRERLYQFHDAEGSNASFYTPDDLKQFYTKLSSWLLRNNLIKDEVLK